MFVKDFILDEIAKEASEVLDVYDILIAVKIFDKDIRVVAEYGEDNEKFWFA